MVAKASFTTILFFLTITTAAAVADFLTTSMLELRMESWYCGNSLEMELRTCSIVSGRLMTTFMSDGRFVKGEIPAGVVPLSIKNNACIRRANLEH